MSYHLVSEDLAGNCAWLDTLQPSLVELCAQGHCHA